MLWWLRFRGGRGGLLFAVFLLVVVCSGRPGRRLHIKLVSISHTSEHAD